MATYATILDVQARLPGRSITSSSKPSQLQIETWLDEAEAYLAGAIEGGGGSLPTVGSRGATILRSLVCDYAEAHTRMAHAAAGGDGGNDDGKDLLDKWYGKLNEIERGNAGWVASMTSTDTSKIRGANTDTSADDYLAPEFNRDEVW